MKLAKLWIGVLALLFSTLSSAAVTYTYDSLNRLTGVDYDNGTSQAYSYDAAGNLLNVTTVGAPVDTIPDAFSFTPVTGAAPASLQSSNTITVSGINSVSAISIAGGTYSINGGAYTSAAGTVNSGNTVTVRQTASASYSTTTAATLTIGGVSGAFNVTTGAVGTTPDTSPTPFSFTAQTGATRSSVVTSNTITVTGINTASTISIVGGSYSINGGAYTTATETVNSGQTVSVRQTSSASYSTMTAATLTIGGISGTFNVTTLAAPVTPPNCTLAASATLIPLGGTSLLTASCTPAATSYAWSANTGFGSSVTMGTVSPSVTTTYTLTGSNAGGPGNTASATVTVVAPPVCALVPLSPSMYVGAAQFFSAICTNDPTSYQWAVDGGNVAATQSTYITALPLGPHTVSVTATNAAGSGSASTSVTVSVFTPPSASKYLPALLQYLMQ